jgi:hypothetical protein
MHGVSSICYFIQAVIIYSIHSGTTILTILKVRFYPEVENLDAPKLKKRQINGR